MNRRDLLKGPQSSIPLSALNQKQINADEMKPDASRHDKRALGGLRPIYLTTGVVDNADGSAYFESHHMKLIVSVFGPREAQRSKKFDMKARLNIDLKFASFSSMKRTSMSRTEVERDFSQQIEKAILPSILVEKYPKLDIDVHIAVLEMDGMASCMAASISATSIALADAGIEMRDLVSASSVSLISPGVMFADATELEEKKHTGSVFVAVMPSIDEVTHVYYHGKIEASAVVEGFQCAVENASKYNEAMVRCLADSIQ
jgi:exosome complex component MTR3